LKGKSREFVLDSLTLGYAFFITEDGKFAISSCVMVGYLVCISVEVAILSSGERERERAECDGGYVLVEDESYDQVV
jgi:hypothetical protein